MIRKTKQNKADSFLQSSIAFTFLFKICCYFTAVLWSLSPNVFSNLPEICCINIWQDQVKLPSLKTCCVVLTPLHLRLMEVSVDSQTRGISPLKTTRRLDLTSCGTVYPPSLTLPFQQETRQNTQKLQEPPHLKNQKKNTRETTACDLCILSASPPSHPLHSVH